MTLNKDGRVNCKTVNGIMVVKDAANKAVIVKNAQAGTYVVAALYQGDRMCGCAVENADSAGNVSISLPTMNGDEYVKVFMMNSSLSPIAEAVQLDFS